MKEQFVTMSAWLGVTALDASADSITVNGRQMTFMCVSGNIWINPNTTAVANTTAIKLTAGQALDFCVNSVLSIISDGTGANYQYIFWD